MRKTIIQTLLIIFNILPFIITAQTNIKGVVLDNEYNRLMNVSVHWINTNIGTITNTNGEFEITTNDVSEKILIISFIGFENDTIQVNDKNSELIIQLKNPNNLNAIELTENKQGAYIDNTKTIKTEIITKEELTKAACCDLAGCFETQMSVESKTTNIITNTKELSILGLSGAYNHILIDGLPIVNGANYTYGVSSIPGTLIKEIFISQGLASVLQGPESITGQITILLKEHQKNERLFLNLYTNSFLNKQLNLDYNFKTKKWLGIASIHTTQPANKIDHNDDNFLDLPQTTKYAFYNKWVNGLENSQGLYTSISLRYLNEKRVGGQMDFNEETDKGSSLIYGQIIHFSQPEAILKTSYNFNNKNALNLQSAVSKHNQNSFFGSTEYSSNQLNYYTKLSYKLNWKTHQTRTGLDFKHLKLNEEITLNNFVNETLPYNRGYAGKYLKNENISGIFIENNFKWKNNIELITGFRMDHHNTHGIFYTPRMLLRYDVSENTTIRANIGKGWRTINLFTEHIHILSSNREIKIADDLKPEEAINFGVNFLHAIYLENIELQLITDFYITDFSNQIFPDYHSNSDIINIENFEEESTSQSFQIELGAEIKGQLGLKIAYNYLDVFRLIDNEKFNLPFIATHHILHTLSYQPLNKDWFFDINLHWFGEKKLISTHEHTDHSHEETSDPYSVLNAQFTKKISNFELYIGCENILNFTQENPILNSDNPFSTDFNILNIWGPTKGREAYIGIRLII